MVVSVLVVQCFIPNVDFLNKIQQNIFYSESLKRLLTQYPLMLPPNALTNNYEVVPQNLCAIN